MKRYVLDTNIYITAARDAAFGSELVRFVANVLPLVYLHSVVVQELVRGAISESARRSLDREIIQPFEKRGRIIVPRYGAWKRSAEMVAELVEARHFSKSGVPASFMSDALLAASCREDGLTLITLNHKDFTRLARLTPFPFHPPWPQ